jgi:4-amino-4-deoxy-L-arabinose transferase-like glycosyltransferase
MASAWKKSGVTTNHKQHLIRRSGAGMMDIKHQKKSGTENRSSHARRFLLLGVCIILGAVPRFAALDDIPGLEHDEALICLGAADIAEGNAYPLTGDKIYEGPLLEYVIAFFMRFGGITEMTARYVMTGAGLMAIAAIFWAGVIIGGTKTGLFSAMLLLFSTWHLAASRVIYTCNITQVFIPLSIAWFGIHLKSDKTRSLILAGLALGLAANGRFTSYFLVLPALLMLFIYKKKHALTQIPVFLVSSIFPSLPLLLYNILHSWPALSVLKGSGQAHLLQHGSHLVPKITGFIQTAAAALTGKRFWLDINWTPVLPVYIVPVLILPGIWSAFRHDRLQKNGSKWILYTLIGLVIFIPIVTKANDQNEWNFHPHYLDLVMPFLMLLCGFGLQMLDYRKPGLGLLVALAIVTWQAFLVFGQLAPFLQREGVPGRWSGRSTLLARCIAHNFENRDTSVVVPWRFGAGYPQIAFILRDYSVVPVLDSFQGFALLEKRQARSRIVHVSPEAPLPVPPWYIVTCSGDDHLKVYTIDSPGFYINGTWHGDDGRLLTIRSVSPSDHSCEWPDLTVTEEADSVRLAVVDRRAFTRKHPLLNGIRIHAAPRHAGMYRTFEEEIFAHQLTADDESADQWKITWASPTYPESRVRIQKGAYLMEGHWLGTAVFY